jgi:hypothetical protein
MSGLTIDQRPLTQKQADILTYLRRALPKGGPQSSAMIAEATGYTGVSTTLQSLKFRGIVTLGKLGSKMAVVGVKRQPTR